MDKYSRVDPIGEFDAPSQLKMGNIFFIQFTMRNDSNVKDAIGLSINQGTTLNHDWQGSGLIVESIREKEIGQSMEG